MWEHRPTSGSQLHTSQLGEGSRLPAALQTGLYLCREECEDSKTEETEGKAWDLGSRSQVRFVHENAGR